MNGLSNYSYFRGMAWNYRKRVKIAPGVHLNFSKSGVSTSIGPKGAKVTFGKNGTYMSTSIPGTVCQSETLSEHVPTLGFFQTYK